MATMKSTLMLTGQEADIIEDAVRSAAEAFEAQGQAAMARPYLDILDALHGAPKPGDGTRAMLELSGGSLECFAFALDRAGHPELAALARKRAKGLGRYM